MKNRLILFAIAVLFTTSAYAADYVDGKKLDNFEVTEYDGMSAPSVSPANAARLYYDSTADKLKLSENGGAWGNIGAGGEEHVADHIEDTVYGASWDGSLQAATKNSLYDKIQTIVGGSGAPTDADYLVGTANGSLSAEIVVGTTPGGELGGTWGTPTIDDSVSVTSWNLTTPTITTSLTTSTPTTLSAAELDRLDGLAGVIVTDTTAATEIDGDGLTITTGTLNFDGGASPGGSLGGTWASPTIDDLFLKNDASDVMIGTLTADGLILGSDESLTLGPTTLKYNSTTADTELSDDLIIKDPSSPSTWWVATDWNTAFGFHYHPNTNYPFALWYGTNSASGISLGNAGFPLWYVDSSLNFKFPNNNVTIEKNLTVTGTTTIGTLLGAIDAGGATSFEIPNAASPTVNVAGQIAIDTTDNALIYYDGASSKVLAHPVQSAYFVFANDGDWDNETLPIAGVRKDMAITIVQVDAVAIGGTSLTFNIEERAWASYNSAGTNITGSTIVADADGISVTSFSNAGIAAQAGLFLTTGASAASGTVNFVMGTVYYIMAVE